MFPSDASRVRRVAVTGLGSFTGPAIVRSLRASHPSLEVWGLDARPDTEALLLCDHARVIPRAQEGLREALLALVEEAGLDLVIPALDPELEELAPLAEDFRAWGCLLLAGGAPFIRLCRSKADTAAFLRSRDLPFAPTWRCEGVEDPEGLPYPLLVKPDAGSGGKGQRLVMDAGQWRSDLGPRRGLVAQPLLRAKGGRGEAWTQPEFAVQTLHDGEGRLAGLFAGVSRKRSGASWSLAPFRDPGLERVVTAMAEALVPLGLLEGPCNFQGIFTDEGPVVFEVNPRFTGATALRAALGFQEVAACLAMLAEGLPAAAVAGLLTTRMDCMALRSSTEHLVPQAALSPGP